MAYSRKGKSVAPHHSDRTEMAMRTRHGLKSTARMVLVELAMRCDKTKPNEASVAVEYLRQKIGGDKRTINAALKTLIDKKLIERDMDPGGNPEVARRTIINWALIMQDQFEYVPKNTRQEQKCAEADAKLKGFDPWAPVPWYKTSAQDEVTEGDPVVDAETDAADQAVLSDPIFDLSGEVPAKSAASPAATAVKSTSEYDDEPQVRALTHKMPATKPKPPVNPAPKKPALDPQQIGVLREVMLKAKEFGSYHFTYENIDFAAATEYFAKESLKLAWVDLKMKDGSVVRSMRLAPPINEYAARRLSDESGKVIRPNDLTTLLRKKGELYSILEYALCTESWCTWLKSKADKPAGWLIAKWESKEGKPGIAEAWENEGGFWYDVPKKEESAPEVEPAEEPTPIAEAAPEEEPAEESELEDGADHQQVKHFDWECESKELPRAWELDEPAELPRAWELDEPAELPRAWELDEPAVLPLEWELEAEEV